MSYETITVESEGPLAVITVSRPKALNALNSTVLSELSAAVAELELSPEVRVVALTGAGDKAFVAGADIAEMKDATPLEGLALSELGGSLAASMETSSKIYVAAVNGFALGGGCELAMACDFIYASPNAKLGQPEVKLGLIPGFGGTQRLTRRVGPGKAMELLVTGDHVSAEEALRIGLVDAVVPAEELLDKVRKIAKRVAGNGPLAVSECKKLVHAGASIDLEAAILLEQRAFGTMFATEDKVEGTTAFIEKRKAEFKGK